MQVPKQLAAVLLLPEPVREDAAFGVGEPIMQRRRYGIEHIHIVRADVSPAEAVLHLGDVILRNGTVLAQDISVTERLDQVSAVWNAADEFPGEIAAILHQHQAAVVSGNPVSTSLQTLVARLQISVSERSTDIGIVYSHQTDVLEALRTSLNIVVQEPVVQPADVDPEEIEIKRRTVKEWKRWANARGPRSGRFRSEVRQAYRATCVVCGDRFPPTHYSAPGVDAAHILPWTQYDLDEIFNGLCLCKLHHWAFDESLLTLIHESGAYAVELRPQVEQRLAQIDPDFSVATLRRVVGRVEQSRLPRNQAHWPRPQLLELLNASLPDWM
jgi:hypothetical protein